MTQMAECSECGLVAARAFRNFSAMQPPYLCHGCVAPKQEAEFQDKLLERRLAREERAKRRKMIAEERRQSRKRASDRKRYHIYAKRKDYVGRRMLRDRRQPSG